MNAEALSFSLICALAIAIISLSSSYLFRKEQAITPELMAVVSFAPGFVIALISLGQNPINIGGPFLAGIFIKNVFYCLSFYLRTESLRIFGPFVGALMLGMQPVLVFILGAFALDESLAPAQILSVLLVSLSLLLMAGRGTHVAEVNRSARSNIFKYFLVPTFFSALVIIWDREFLRNELAANDFFILDRISVVPAFFLASITINGRYFIRGFWNGMTGRIVSRNWFVLATIGIMFTVSVFTYNHALALEKAALVSLIRNSAYPLAAFVGAFIFQQHISLRKWASFVIVLMAVVLGAI